MPVDHQTAFSVFSFFGLDPEYDQYEDHPGLVLAMTRICVLRSVALSYFTVEQGLFNLTRLRSWDPRCYVSSVI